jgi:hypothetical protein
MEGIVITLPETMLSDEAEMRAFYESCGISKATTEAAIRARQNRPVDEDKKGPSPVKGRKRKASAPASK